MDCQSKERVLCCSFQQPLIHCLSVLGELDGEGSLVNFSSYTFTYSEITQFLSSKSEFILVRFVSMLTFIGATLNQ